MDRFQSALVECIDLGRPFSAKDLCVRTGFCRQYVNRRLREQVAIGALASQGDPPSVRYVRMPELGRIRHRPRFWEALCDRHPSVRYLRLAEFGQRFREQRQIRRFAELVRGASFVVLDFAQVEHASERFVRGLHLAIGRHGADVEAINLPWNPSSP